MPGSRSLFRAIDVDAPVDTTFRWLCQLKVAPYSYDLIDNLGRRSPRTLTPGAERLALGQRWAVVFDIVDFVDGRQITGDIRPSARRLFGPISCTYQVNPRRAGTSRLVVRMDVRGDGRGPAGYLLAAGDLVMMRKQLVTLARLAETV